MNKKTTMTKDGTQVHQSRGYSKILNAIWSAVLLCLVFTSGCKKDEFKGEVAGLCPIIVTTDPLDKAIDVALNKVISATFNTDMDSTTITKASFTLTQGGTAVSGKVATTASSKTFTFTPDVPLLPFTVYTGTITTASADRFRTKLVNDYVWTFTTIPQITVSSAPLLGGVTTGGGTFAQGSTVTVVATPNAGFTFANWTVNGVVVSSSASYQFVVAGNRTLVANYTAVPVGNFAVVLSSSPVAGGTTAGAGSFPTGSVVTVTAAPNSGYTFVNWTQGGVIVSTSSSYQFVLVANRTLVANFLIIPSSQFALVLSSNPVVGGTTAGSGAYAAGTSVTATATPNANYSFVSWTENGVVVSASAAYTFALNANRTLVANFALNIYTLTLSANPAAGGTTTGTGPYNAGTNAPVTATANAGYNFVNWTEGGVIVSTNATDQFLMSGNRTIVANFTPITFTLNVTAVNGSVVKAPNQATYNSGSTVTLTATPNAGYSFAFWSVDASGSANPLTVTMNANKNITANFTLIPPSILGTAALFGAFGGNAGITNQGINTVINNGRIGTTAAPTLITGFHDGLTNIPYTETPLNIGLVTGGIFTNVPAPGTAASALIASNALIDANAAYVAISPASKPGGTDPGAGELGGLTVFPGTYKSSGATFAITNLDLTLDGQGDPNAVWIFQCAGRLTVGKPGVGGARSMILKNGAQAKNVYWYVGSDAIINAAGGGIMAGTIISSAGVVFSTAGVAAQTVLNGRALSLIASVTMVNTTINVP